MPKYRKKPVVIDAIQFTGNNQSKLMAWVIELDARVHWHFHDCVVDIPTLEGTMTASSGDWIICGVNGEFYPCKPDIFDKTYERVDDAHAQGDNA